MRVTILVVATLAAGMLASPVDAWMRQALDAPGCGRDCTGCPTAPACLNGRPKIEKPCCWTSTGPKNKDGFCYQYREDDNNCGACGRKCGEAQRCCSGACKALLTDTQNCGTW